MKMLVQQKINGEWHTIGALSAIGENPVVSTGLEGRMIGDEPIWSDPLNRLVWPKEGEMYLMALDESKQIHGDLRLVVIPDEKGAA